MQDKYDLCQETGICPKSVSRTTFYETILLSQNYFCCFDYRPFCCCEQNKSTRLSDEACTMCEEVIGTMKYALQMSEIRTSVKAALESLCAETGSLASECKLAVDMIFDKAYDYLLNLLVR